MREAAKKEFYQRRSEALTPQPFPCDSLPSVWPSFISDHYEDGKQFLLGDERRINKIADDRGWPSHWVTELIHMGLMSAPWLPWATPGRKFASRGKAFAVQCPKPVEGDPGNLTLFNVGYHQRFWRKDTNSKSWMFIPCRPKSRNYRTPFVQRLIEFDESIPGLPYVMGDLNHPSLIVIAEGQWDSITLFGSCGWMDSDSAFPGGVAVFGLRGVAGSEQFLKWYGAWIAINKPCAIVLADNDQPGRALLESKSSKNGPPDPTFCQRLKAYGCRKVVAFYPTIDEAKDFNDLWKLKKFSPDQMQTFIADATKTASEPIPI